MTLAADKSFGQLRGNRTACLIIVAALLGCVPNRQIAYPTAQATGCSPNDIFLSNIASRTSEGDGVETWNAECLRRHFRCTRSKGVTTCQEISAAMALQTPNQSTTEEGKPLGTADLTQTISPLIHRIWDAYRKGDAAAHSALLADDYTAVHPDGSVHLRKPTAQEIRSAPIGAYILSDLRVVPTGSDAALANYLATVEIPDAPKLGKFVVGEVWVKQGGEWKCRYYQATPLK
jgi:ketosteroid isomerase-like protein